MLLYINILIDNMQYINEKHAKNRTGNARETDSDEVSIRL